MPQQSLRARDWFRQRLSPRGDNVMMLACYGTIMAALIMLILQRPQTVAPWRLYGGIAMISGLLALNLILPDIAERFGSRPRAELLYFALASALFLAGMWLSGSSAFFYLLFMLSAQAFVMLRFRWGLIYTALMTAAVLALVVWGLGGSSNMQALVLSLMAGIFFTASFAVVIVRYGEQTERATHLLAELQKANAALEAAGERERDLAVAEERVRLARDIHDGLGHHLTVLSVQIQAASKLLERDPARAAQALAVCREETEAALAEVRTSVAAMRRSPLDGRTLEEALAALVRDFDQRAGLRAEFSLAGAAWPLPPAASQTLYRAAQEGLTNAQKHAAASQALVRLEYRPDEAALSVEDDGAGADNGQAPGFGLAGLRERAEQLGGSCAAATRPGGGFSLLVRLPRQEHP
jgi:signal transduction histidine kinase